MPFVSTKDLTQTVSFAEAILSGIPADGGLYVPTNWNQFSAENLEKFTTLEWSDLAAHLAYELTDHFFPLERYQALCRAAYDFPLKIKVLDERLWVLELFHGPTLAFKDFGARFMGLVVEELLKESDQKRTVLVATSGDTGAAVAHAFGSLTGVRVVLLFPRQGVSYWQRQQLSKIGENVQSLEVQGSFDDCQALVKQAFLDQELKDHCPLLSVNSINLGRVIPQIFYYFWLDQQVQKMGVEAPSVISVPSGNLGNSLGAVLAKSLGVLPETEILAAHNANAPLCRALETGVFEPRKSVPTLSNAMDIGHPNNFYRLDHFSQQWGGSLEQFIAARSCSDAETIAAIQAVESRYGYQMCPHTAVGYAALKKQEKSHDLGNGPRVVVGTAHPVKFSAEISEYLQTPLKVPQVLKNLEQQASHSQPLEVDYDALKRLLLEG